MFPSITSVKKLRIERSDDFEPTAASLVSQPSSIATMLKALGSSIEDDSHKEPVHGTEMDYSILIDRIRSSANRVRDVEARAREREEEVEDVLERARADLRIADERIRAAEMQTSQIEREAADRIRAAEARATAAEERALACEMWLRRIHETIFSEFGVSDETTR